MRRFLLCGLLLFTSCAKSPVELSVSTTFDAAVTADTQAKIKQFIFVARPAGTGRPVLFPSSCVDTAHSDCLMAQVCGFSSGTTFPLNLPLVDFADGQLYTLVACGTDALQTVIVAGKADSLLNQAGAPATTITLSDTDLSVCNGAFPPKCP